MTEPKTPRKRTPKKAVNLDSLVKKVEKPDLLKTIENYNFPGRDALEEMMPGHANEIDGLVKKFQSRYAVTLSYIHKFRSFKCLRGKQHVDWLTLNELLKRYDTGISPVAMPLQPQRPYKNDRVY